jgi:hypothetical protein
LNITTLTRNATDSTRDIQKRLWHFAIVQWMAISIVPRCFEVAGPSYSLNARCKSFLCFVEQLNLYLERILLAYMLIVENVLYVQLDF